MPDKIIGELFQPRRQRYHYGQRNRNSDIHWQLRSLLSSGGSPVDPVWRILHNLEDFHLTLRRADWDRWEDNKALEIPALRSSATSRATRSVVEGQQPTPDWPALPSWGRMFESMANLKTLSISFETSEDRAHEMENILAWARTWRFEIKSWRFWLIKHNQETMAHLVADDKPVRKMSWQGLFHHWPDKCPGCSALVTEAPKPDCSSCQEREALMKQRIGPRLLVWTLTWRRVMVDPPVSLEDTEVRGPDDYK